MHRFVWGVISAIIKSLNFAIHSWIYDVLLCCYDIRIVNFPFIIGFMMFCYAVMTFELSIFHCEMLTCNYGNIIFIRRIFIRRIFIRRVFIRRIFIRRVFIRRVFIWRVFIRRVFIRRVFIRRVFIRRVTQKPKFTSASERGLGGMVENADYGLRTADSDCRPQCCRLGLRTRIADSDCGLGRYFKWPPIIMYHYSLYTHIYLHIHRYP